MIAIVRSGFVLLLCVTQFVLSVLLIFQFLSHAKRMRFEIRFWSHGDVIQQKSFF